jgi:phospholipid transport system substrate-binding protein
MDIQRTRNTFPALFLLVAIVSATVAAHAQPPGEAPDALIRRLSSEMMGAIRTDDRPGAGDESSLVALADQRLMPHVNLGRMTALAVGRHWRKASPEQKTRLQEGVRRLLLLGYAGALAETPGRSLVVKPLRGSAEDFDVHVRTELTGRGEPVQLAYRLEKTGDVWKIYDVNLRGEWLVERYRPRFADEIGSSGLDSLIEAIQAGKPFGKDRLIKVRLTTSMGVIVLQLEDEAISTDAASFLALVRAGYYDGTLFHRVIPGVRIQGGGYDARMREKSPGNRIARARPPGMMNDIGSIGFARASDPISGGAQFYINAHNNMTGTETKWGDYIYPTFGDVVEGMGVVISIGEAPTRKDGMHEYLPLEPILIERAEVLPVTDH